LIVMAGLSRLKDGVASAPPMPGHPRSFPLQIARTWMPGTSGAKTRFALLVGHDEEAHACASSGADAAEEFAGRGNWLGIRPIHG
jgi:hypothetical protein